jgi:hypothetical protein
MYMCVVDKLFMYLVDKFIIYVMCTNYLFLSCAHIIYESFELIIYLCYVHKLLQICSDDDDEDFFKMIFDSSMLGQTYVDMFLTKTLQVRLQQVEWVYVGAFQHSRRMP